MDNITRRQLLDRHRRSGFPGSIIDVYKAYDQGIDLIGQFEQQQQLQKQNIDVASTPQEVQQGLRPAHAAGDVNKSMLFPNIPPNTPFTTVGMKAPINIQKFDNQGHLVKSYENVPPGIKNLPMGPHQGTVLETPAQMQSGGVRVFPRDTVNLPPAEVVGYPNVNVADRNYHWNMSRQGTIDQYRPGWWELVKEGMREDDSTFENFLEFFDVTGIGSWDDAYRAHNSMRDRGPEATPTWDEALDMFGAVPLVGKFKIGVNLSKGAARNIKNLKNSWASTYNYLSKWADSINRVDAVEDETGFLDSKKTGGIRKYQWAGPKIDGPRTPAMSDAEMSLKIIQEANAGNPAARRMRSDYGQRMFLPKETNPSTHYMASFDNYAVPTVQEDYLGGPLSYNPNPAPSKADFRFNTPEQAAYFAKNYKQASAAKTFQQKNGGVRKAQTGLPPYYVSSKNDPRYIAYNDSLNLNLATLEQDKLMGSGSYKSTNNIDYWTPEQLQDARTPKYHPILGYDIAVDYQNQEHQFRDNDGDGKIDYNITARREDEQLINYYKSLGFTDDNIMYHSSPDLVHPTIKPSYTYFDGTAESPYYAAPKQEVILSSKLPSIQPKQISTSIQTPELQIPKIPKYLNSTPIYQQDPSVSTGQYQIGENMWDPNKKQWFRSLFDKEMQDTFRQNAVPRKEKWRTIETPPGGFKNGGVRKAQAGLPPFSLQPTVSESTYQPSYGEQAFLNQMAAGPREERVLDIGSTISQGNFEVDENNNIIEDRPSYLEMAANPMATARAILNPAVEGLPSQVEFDQSINRGNPIGLAANDIVNPAAWANYGANALSDLGQGNFLSAGINALSAVPGLSLSGTTAATAGKQALNATVGQGIRNIAYNMVDPFEYTPRFLTPKQIIRNVLNPAGRPSFHQGLANAKNPVSVAGAARRLDALAIGLGKKPRYNTLRQIGDNTYEPINGPVNVKDILRTTEDALNSRLASTGELGEKGSTIGITDGTFKTMGGYHLVDEAVPNNPMLRRIIMNDTWDLHPFQDFGVEHFANSYPVTKKIWNALPTRAQNYVSDRFRDLEVFNALGGKPIDIQSRWTAEMANNWATSKNVGPLVLTNDATGRSFNSYLLDNRLRKYEMLSLFDKPNYKNGGVRKAQAGIPPTVGKTSPDWKPIGTGLRIGDTIYQDSELTGSTRIPLNPETGDALPIMLPEAEVVGRQDYDDSIKEAVSRTNAGVLGRASASEMASYLMSPKKLAEAKFANNMMGEISGALPMERTLNRIQNNPSELFTLEGGLDALELAPYIGGAASMLKYTKAGKRFINNFNDLNYARDWAKQRQYSVPSYLNAVSTKATNESIQKIAKEHNTFARGVGTNPETFSWDTLDELAKLGIDPNDAEKAADYMLTTIPIDTGAGRHGTETSDTFGALYTSNSSKTAEAYARGDGYVGILERPTDFSGPRSKWLDDNDFTVAANQKYVDAPIRTEEYYSPLKYIPDPVIPEAYELFDASKSLNQNVKGVFNNVLAKNHAKTQALNLKQELENSGISRLLEYRKKGSFKLNEDEVNDALEILKQFSYEPKRWHDSNAQFVNETIFGDQVLPGHMYKNAYDNLDGLVYETMFYPESMSNFAFSDLPKVTEYINRTSLPHTKAEVLKQKALNLSKIKGFDLASLNFKPDRYTHYIFQGAPGEIPVKLKRKYRIDDGVDKSRAHIGKREKGFSTKRFGGTKKYFK